MPQSFSCLGIMGSRFICVFQVLKTNKKINLYFPERCFNWKKD